MNELNISASYTPLQLQSSYDPRKHTFKCTHPDARKGGGIDRKRPHVQDMQQNRISNRKESQPSILLLHDLAALSRRALSSSSSYPYSSANDEFLNVLLRMRVPIVLIMSDVHKEDSDYAISRLIPADAQEK